MDEKAVAQEVDGNASPIVDYMEGPPLPNTPAPLTSPVDSIPSTETGGERKKSSSSALTGSVVTLKRRGSDTIRIVTSPERQSS